MRNPSVSTVDPYESSPSSFVSEANRFRSRSPMNAMSIDVEDYFQVSAFAPYISQEQWPEWPARVVANTERILELFAACGVRATFFTLGWIAERFPQLVRRVADNGHEIASHGMRHTRVTEQSPSEFQADAERSKKLLEDTSGQRVTGYRAATWSIGSGNLWAHDVLQALGFEYSSSIYPIRHDLYGMPDAPRFAFRCKPGGLLEIPVSTVTLRGRRLPCGGGGYFRLFPYRFSRWALQRVNTEDEQPSVFYFHPWEIDPDQPRVTGLQPKARFRHYLNLKRMEARIRRLVVDFRWGRMDRIFLS